MEGEKYDNVFNIYYATKIEIKGFLEKEKNQNREFVHLT